MARNIPFYWGEIFSQMFSPHISSLYEYFLLCTNVLMVSRIFAILPPLSPYRTVNINPDLLGFLVD